MSGVITLATVDYGPQERHEALYLDGVLLKAAEDEKFCAADVLEVLATHNITVRVAYVDVDLGYDQDVISGDGWPEALADVKVREGAST
jgi:hypothetical protein